MKQSISFILILSMLLSLTFNMVVNAEITENLVVWLTMDMDTSEDGILQDASGNGVQAKIQNNPLAAGGAIDGAIQFNGNGASVMIPHKAQDSFSISFWMKTNEKGPNGGQWYQARGLVDAEVGGVTNDFGVGLINGNIIFGVGNPDTNVISKMDVTDNVWHHVVCTRDSKTGDITIYIDGKLDNKTNAPNKAALTAPKQVKIGGGQGGPDFIGAIDEVRIYKSVISEADIKVLLSKENQVPPEVEDDVNPFYKTSAFKKGSDKILIQGFDSKMSIAGNPAKVEEIDGILYVPARYAAACFGEYAKWDNKTRSISLSTRGKVVTMTEGSNDIVLQDGSKVTAKGPFKIKDNTVIWLPFEDIMKAIGQKVVISDDIIMISAKNITDEVQQKVISEMK